MFAEIGNQPEINLATQPVEETEPEVDKDDDEISAPKKRGRGRPAASEEEKEAAKKRHQEDRQIRDAAKKEEQAQLTKSGKPKRVMTDAQRQNLEKARATALANRKRKAAEVAEAMVEKQSSMKKIEQEDEDARFLRLYEKMQSKLNDQSTKGSYNEPKKQVPEEKKAETHEVKNRPPAPQNNVKQTQPKVVRRGPVYKFY